MLGLYVHVPFCRSRCAYCDFYLVVDGKPGTREVFVEALRREVECEAPAHAASGKNVDSVYFGGGTPSLLQPAEIASVLNAVRSSFSLSGRAEITLEANPEDLDGNYLGGIREAGVTRLSLGWQSADAAVLKRMGRHHDAAGAGAAFRAARNCGFESINLDLICGYPGEGRDSWRRSLEAALSLRPDHLSLYLLERHEGTWLDRQLGRGALEVVPDEETAERYEEAAGEIESRGLAQYEISNFARPGHESRHNLKYWSDQLYLGFGPGAHSYIFPRRRANAPHLRRYCDALLAGQAPPRTEETLSEARHAAERMLLGLRKTAGHDLSPSDERFLATLDEAVERHVQSGLLEKANGRLALTPRGRLLANEVLEIFV
jgi:oxygen-independent coproporphyrinogen-3 oxidase